MFRTAMAPSSGPTLTWCTSHSNRRFSPACRASINRTTCSTCTCPSTSHPATRLAREITYRAFCAEARTVVMMTGWGKADITSKYGLPRMKVCVVPGASVLHAYAEPTSADVGRCARISCCPSLRILSGADVPAQKPPDAARGAGDSARSDGDDDSARRLGHQNEFFPRIAQRARSFVSTAKYDSWDSLGPWSSARCIAWRGAWCSRAASRVGDSPWSKRSMRGRQWPAPTRHRCLRLRATRHCCFRSITDRNGRTAGATLERRRTPCPPKCAGSSAGGFAVVDTQCARLSRALPPHCGSPVE